MRIAGADPGKLGVITVLSADSAHGWYHPLNYNKAGYLDVGRVWWFLQTSKPDVLILEKVQGRGGMGATQTFNFGFACGELNALLRCYADQGNCLGLKYASPQEWQKVIHEGIGGKLKPKERTELAYERLFPHKPIPTGPKGGKINDNVVDALMLATYGVLKLGGGVLRPWTLTKVEP